MKSNCSTVSDQNIPTPYRDQVAAIADRIGSKVDELIEELEKNDPAAGFFRMMDTISHVGRAWFGDHDEDVKELMEFLRSDDNTKALKKELKAAHDKGLPIYL